MYGWCAHVYMPNRVCVCVRLFGLRMNYCAMWVRVRDNDLYALYMIVVCIELPLSSQNRIMLLTYMPIEILCVCVCVCVCVLCIIPIAFVDRLLDVCTTKRGLIQQPQNNHKIILVSHTDPSSDIVRPSLTNPIKITSARVSLVGTQRRRGHVTLPPLILTRTLRHHRATRTLRHPP